jgi:hypothetical protein
MARLMCVESRYDKDGCLGSQASGASANSTCFRLDSSDSRHMTVESALLTEWRAATEKDEA